MFPLPSPDIARSQVAVQKPQQGGQKTPLLGREVLSYLSPTSKAIVTVFEHDFVPTSNGLGFLKDHKVHNMGIMPGTAYLEMVVEAVAHMVSPSILNENKATLRNISITGPIMAETPSKIQMTIEGLSDSTKEAQFTLSSTTTESTDQILQRPQPNWVVNCSGFLLKCATHINRTCLYRT
jgi:hypothetical protein